MKRDVKSSRCSQESEVFKMCAAVEQKTPTRLLAHLLTWSVQISSNIPGPKEAGRLNGGALRGGFV